MTKKIYVLYRYVWNDKFLIFLVELLLEVPMANGKIGEQKVRQNAVKRQNAVSDGRHDEDGKMGRGKKEFDRKRERRTTRNKRHSDISEKIGKRENQIMQALFGTEGRNKFHSILSSFCFFYPFPLFPSLFWFLLFRSSSPLSISNYNIFQLEHYQRERKIHEEKKPL